MMNDPARSPLWAALQAELLVVSAILVGWYLVETRRMRKASEAQVKKSQDLVEAAQRQLEASGQQLAAMQVQTKLAQAQLEAQIRPAVSVYDDPNLRQFRVKNVGSGPALDLKFVMEKHGNPVMWDAAANLSTNLNGSVLWAGGRSGLRRSSSRWQRAARHADHVQEPLRPGIRQRNHVQQRRCSCRDSP